MAKHNAIGAGGLCSIPGPVKSDNVANGSRPLHVSVLPSGYATEMGPATRYTLCRSTTSIMKIDSFLESSKEAVCLGR